MQWTQGAASMTSSRVFDSCSSLSSVRAAVSAPETPFHSCTTASCVCSHEWVRKVDDSWSSIWCWGQQCLCSWPSFAIVPFIIMLCLVYENRGTARTGGKSTWCVLYRFVPDIVIVSLKRAKFTCTPAFKQYLSLFKCSDTPIHHVFVWHSRQSCLCHCDYTHLQKSGVLSNSPAIIILPPHPFHMLWSKTVPLIPSFLLLLH